MKKLIALIIAVLFVTSFSACRDNTGFIPQSGNKAEITSSKIYDDADRLPTETEISLISETLPSEIDDNSGFISAATELNDYANVASPEICDDYPSVIVERSRYDNENGILCITFYNYGNVDLEHVWNFQLYKNGVFIDFADAVGVCGTPDVLRAGEVFEMSYPIIDIYNDIQSGNYQFMVNFTEKINQYENRRHQVHGDFFIGKRSGQVLYDVVYPENGDVSIIYINDTDTEITFGMGYELFNSSGEKITFLENTGFIEIAMLMIPGGSNHLALNISSMFGELPSGDYTVVHQLWGSETITVEIPISL